jgi:peptide/nickel transport system permease protein
VSVAQATAPTATYAEPPVDAAARPTARAVGGWVRRILNLVAITAAVLLLASVITFALGAMAKTNPAAAVLGETATEADIARLDHQFGLDRPLVVQYADWLGSALQGDSGSPGSRPSRSPTASPRPCRSTSPSPCSPSSWRS